MLRGYTKKMNEKLENILDGFKDLKVAVVGDSIVDLSNEVMVRGYIKECPKTPLPDVVVLDSKIDLGGAANVANNLVSLDIDCDLYGVIGEDSESKSLINHCQRAGINPRFVFDESKKTPVKERFFINENGKRSQIGLRVTRNEGSLKGISRNVCDSLFRDFKSNIDRYGGVVISDYDKGVFRGDGEGSYLAKKIIDLCNSKNLPIVVDVKPKNVSYFKGCTVICPNRKEAHEMSGGQYSEPEDLGGVCEEIKKRLSPNPPKYVVVTCDEDGAFIYNQGESQMVKTTARIVGDVTGAGDTFTVGLVGMLGLKKDIYESAKFANMLAGIAVEESGTSVVTADKIKRALNRG